MSKIPVGATIAQAYRFAFGGSAQILRIIWLPWLIVAAGGFFLRSSTRALSAANTEIIKRTSHYWYIVYPIYAVLAGLFYGLGCGAQCFAYQALAPELPSASHL